jgi:Tfp pilus assembly protein PilE
MKSENGRSMVEMLGVLAIIGVLSVGAIAGYSKAMMKYKLNKQAEQINTVINAVARNIHSFDNIQADNNSTTPITKYFTKMGEIPVEMLTSSANYLNDIFKTEIYIALNKTETGAKNMAIFFMLDRLKTKSTDNLEICKNIVLTAKENRDSITYVEVVGDYKSDSSDVYTVWGDQRCTASRVCLKNISMDNIYTMCTKLIGKQNVNLQIVWNI